MGGDLGVLVGLLAPDARLLGDGGGKAKAPLRVIQSADKVARFLRGIAEKPVPEPGFVFLEVNGGPAVLVTSRGLPAALVAVDVAGGRIQSVYLIANPDKLGGLLPGLPPRPPHRDPSTGA